MFNESDVLDWVSWEGRPAVVVSPSDGRFLGFVIRLGAERGNWTPASPLEILESGRILSKASFQEVFKDRLKFTN
jgi:hypothetical protein